MLWYILLYRRFYNCPSIGVFENIIIGHCCFPYYSVVPVFSFPFAFVSYLTFAAIHLTQPIVVLTLRLVYSLWTLLLFYGASLMASHNFDFSYINLIHHLSVLGS